MAPCVEIMWRQARHAWGHGYVVEAAAAALADGFDRIETGEIFAWTADTNLRSRYVMQRLGMQHQPARDSTILRCRKGTRCVGTSCMPLAPPVAGA